MKAIEFETEIRAGMIKLPEILTDWFDTPARVILLGDDAEPPPMIAQTEPVKAEVRAFFKSVQIDLSGYHFNRDEANER
jgi:hypothetical protein